MNICHELTSLRKCRVDIACVLLWQEALEEGGELHNKKVYLFGCTERKYHIEHCDLFHFLLLEL